MIFFICIIIGFLIGAICYAVEWGYLDIEGFLIGITGAFVGLLVGFIVLLIGFLCFDGIAQEDRVIKEVGNPIELIALKDNFNTHGSGFIFSSYVDEDLYYIYIYEDEQRGMSTNKIKADSAYIKYLEDDTTKPYIQEWMEESNNAFLNWLFCWGEYGYTIYLPQGSVIENVYEINLE